MTHIRFALIVLVAGCAQAPQRPIERPVDGNARYVAVSFTMLPGWSEARHAASLQAFLAGGPRPSLARAGAAPSAGPAGDAAAAPRFFRRKFAPSARRA